MGGRLRGSTIQRKSSLNLAEPPSRQTTVRARTSSAKHLWFSVMRITRPTPATNEIRRCIYTMSWARATIANLCRCVHAHRYLYYALHTSCEGVKRPGNTGGVPNKPEALQAPTRLYDRLHFIDNDDRRKNHAMVCPLRFVVITSLLLSPSVG